MMLDLLVWWLAIVALSRLIAPALTTVVPFGEHALSKPIALVALTYTSWLGTSLGLPHGVSLGLTLTGFAGLWLLTRKWPHRAGIAEEVWFAVVFLAAAFVRSLEPAIFGAEKFMDFALLNACLRTDGMPPEDPWLSGTPVNYYYFGYLLFGNLARLTGVASEVGYQLALATVSAILFTTASAVSQHLTQNRALGVLAGALAAVCGNLDGILQVARGSGIAGFDYWQSSRIVPDTINEFPFFSLLHGDLHPHVTGLVPLAAWIGLATAVAQAPRLRGTAAALLAMTLAAVLLGNPWDLPVALLVLVAALFAQNRIDRGVLRALLSATLGAGSILVVALILTTPFQLHFEPPLRGIGWVRSATALSDLAILFGAPASALLGAIAFGFARHLPADPDRRHLVYALLALAAIASIIITNRPTAVLLAALAAVVCWIVTRPLAEAELRQVFLIFVLPAVAALFACEVVYLRDAYGGALHRMNTVFKLYFQSWVLLAIAAPYGAQRLWRDFGGGALDRFALASLGAVIVSATLVYPLATVLQRVPRGLPTLDGLAFLERDHPEDHPALDWLRSHTSGRPVVVEATGDPYSYFGRVSSITGLPTLLGWANHENLWRANDPVVEMRRRDIDRIYAADLETVPRILRSYQVRYVFVGELERRVYGEAVVNRFRADPERFRPAFVSPGAAVYEVL